MAPSDEPLLARRPSSDHSNDRELAEEEELLTGRTKRESASRRQRWKQYGLIAWAVTATLVVVILAVVYENTKHDRSHAGHNLSGKRNLIFMVSDGMGPTSLSLTRSYRQYADGLSFEDALFLDKYVIGQSRTRSTSSLITDSAAGATAFSCGQKSYNGAISVLPDHSPCGTVMEAAKAAGYMTGLVVTTRITDATPACFAAHVNKRDEEDRIAEQLLGDGPLGLVVDLMLGAGRCHFLSNATEGSCRADDKDMTVEAKKQGFKYTDSRKDFDHLRASNPIKLPFLGLFADHDIPYEIDRRQENSTYPSLAEMAETAIKALEAATADSDQGFFLMIEGSRIDHAGHANDPVAQVHEVLAYDKAFKVVSDFLDKSSTQGLLVATSDHETGGLATARQLRPYEYPAYLWYPGVLANASHSVEWLTKDYARELQLDHAYDRPESVHDAVAKIADAERYLKNALATHLGIHDPSPEELALLVERPRVSPYTFADMISRRSQTGWSTHGHSGADVNIYSSDAEVAKMLQGNVENTKVGEFLRSYLDVDTDAITKKLKSNMAQDWMGAVVEEGERLDGQSHEVEVDHYEGDFKRYKRCEICNI